MFSRAMNPEELDKAIDYLEKRLELAPTVWQYYHYRGRIYLSRGEDGKALADFMAAELVYIGKSFFATSWFAQHAVEKGLWHQGSIILIKAGRRYGIENRARPSG